MTLEVNKSELDSASYLIRRVICNDVLFEAVLVGDKFFSLTKIIPRLDGRFQIETVEVKSGVLMIDVFDFNGTKSLKKLLTFPEPLGANP